jgi:hypothetical protein
MSVWGQSLRRPGATQASTICRHGRFKIVKAG